MRRKTMEGSTRIPIGTALSISKFVTTCELLFRCFIVLSLLLPFSRFAALAHLAHRTAHLLSFRSEFAHIHQPPRMDPEQAEQNQASPEDKKDDNPEHINIKVHALPL